MQIKQKSPKSEIRNNDQNPKLILAQNAKRKTQTTAQSANLKSKIQISKS